MSRFSFMMPTDSQVAIAGGAILVASALAFYLRKSHKDTGFESFPGPKTDFLIGNRRQFPTSKRIETFNAWQGEYGDIVRLSFPGTGVLILHSLDDADELPVKRANIWSGRVGSGMTQPSPEFYEQRKVFRKMIRPNSVGYYDELIEKEAEGLVRALASFTGNPPQHIQDAVGKVVITVAYGESVYKEKGAWLIRLNMEATELVTYAFSNIWLVDIFLFARYLPSWTPGLSFPTVGKRGKIMFDEIRYSPFGMVKTAWCIDGIIFLCYIPKHVPPHLQENGQADFSVISEYFTGPEFSSEYLRDAIGMMYFAAVDTTSSAVLGFLANMLIFPEVQERIQKELSDVIGRDNSPNVAGVQSCSLLQAAWKESLHFSPPVPTSILTSTQPMITGKEGLFQKAPSSSKILTSCSAILVFGGKTHMNSNLSGSYQNLTLVQKISRISDQFISDSEDGRYLAECNGTVFIAAILSAYDVVPPAGESVPTFVEYTDTQIRRPSNLQVFFSPRKSA